MRRRIDDSYICTLPILLLATSAAAAITMQPLADVQRAAEIAARQAIPTSAGTLYARATELDPRLALARCSEPLRAQSAPARSGTARMTVSVHCLSPSRWTVNVSVAIEVEQPVLVVRTPISRGAVITEQEVAVEVRRVPGMTSRYLASIADLTHKIARRPLTAGEVLTSDAVAPAIIVKRGQSLNLVAESGGVAIRATGRAMADGAMQGRIRVQNANSLKIIEGIVESADTVRVGR
jgi:flagella basal body P-ring formation protein FlgA